MWPQTLMLGSDFIISAGFVLEKGPASRPNTTLGKANRVLTPYSGTVEEYLDAECSRAKSLVFLHSLKTPMKCSLMLTIRMAECSLVHIC